MKCILSRIIPPDSSAVVVYGNGQVDSEGFLVALQKPGPVLPTTATAKLYMTLA